MNNYYNQKYDRRAENYQNYQKNPNKTSYDNTYKKRDNSAILRRAINKRYKEDINKNNAKSNELNDLYSEEDDEYDNNNPYKNNDRYINNEENENFGNNNQYNFNNINNEYNSNYNSYNNFIYTDNSNYNSNINSNYSSSPNYNSNNNYSYYDEYSNNNNNHYDKSLLNRINHKKNKNININMNMNLNNYYSTHISKDNIYDEFIIDYKSGINPNQNQTRNSLSRFNTQAHYISNQNPRNMNSTNYERTMALNHNNYNREIYQTSNYRSNNNIHNTINQSHIKYSPYGENTIDYNIPYQKRKINNYTYNPKKYAMMNKSNNNFNNKYNKYNKNNEKYYYRNQSSNVSDDAFMENRQNNSNFKTVELNSNNYNRNYGGLNDDYNNYDNNNIDIGYKDSDSDPFQKTYNIRNNYMQEAQRRYLRQNFINRINEFTNHFSKYCVLYYYKVVVKLFKYLKENKNKRNNKNKYDIKNPRKTIMNNNKRNLTIKNKSMFENKSFSTNRTNYHKYLNKPAETEPKNNKIPHNKNKTNIIIERIKSSNESRSPESKDGTEMYRNLNELSKKFEVISNRRNRLSSNNSFRRNMNDLSFNSENKSIYRNSVEKNKEKWEKTISKERKRRKKILEKNKKKQEEKQKDKKLKSKLQDNKSNKEQEEKKNLSDLILKNEELKAKIQQLKENNNSNNDKNIKNEEKNGNEFGGNNYNRNTISYLNREKIREKYKKKNLKSKAKDKNEMITIKNIISKDKALYIDIKYLNYIPIKDKNAKATNINKSYQFCDNFNINLPAVKAHNDNNKIVIDESKEKDNNIYKLSSIKEENKVEMDLSDDASQNSNENKNSKI